MLWLESTAECGAVTLAVSATPQGFSWGRCFAAFLRFTGPEFALANDFWFVTEVFEKDCKLRCLANVGRFGWQNCFGTRGSTVIEMA